MGFAIWTGLPPGKTVTTSELNLSFVRPFTRDTGNLVGRATSIHQGRQVGLSEVEISDRNGRIMGHATSRCLIMDVSVDLDEVYPEPDLGSDEGPDPYLREPPTDGYFDLETVINGEPLEIQKRIISGDVTPNIQRFTGARWADPEPGRITGFFPHLSMVLRRRSHPLRRGHHLVRRSHHGVGGVLLGGAGRGVRDPRHERPFHQTGVDQQW
jgi:hypothetical protein